MGKIGVGHRNMHVHVCERVCAEYYRVPCMAQGEVAATPPGTETSCSPLLRSGNAGNSPAPQSAVHYDLITCFQRTGMPQRPEREDKCRSPRSRPPKCVSKSTDLVSLSADEMELAKNLPRPETSREAE